LNERVSRRAMKKRRKAERQRTFVVPFRFRGLLMLQIAGIFALSVATYLGPTPDLGFMDVSFYEINAGGHDIAVFINLAIGVLAGAAFAVFSALRERTGNVRMAMQYASLAIAGFVGGFFLLTMVLNILPVELYVGFMNWLMPYVSGLLVMLIFAGPVIMGVYGLLMGRTDVVALSLMSTFLSMFTAFSSFGLEGGFTLENEDLTELFLDELEITVFSISFFVFAEIGLTMGKFTSILGETTFYDRTSENNEFSRLLSGVASGYVPYIIFYMSLTFVFALFSFSADTIFREFMTESLQNAIEHKTIYGKILFTLILFGIMGVLRGIIPAARTALFDKNPKDVDVEWQQ